MSDNTRTVAVILNAASGSGSSADVGTTVERLLGEAGMRATIALPTSGDELTAAIDAAIAARVDVLVAGGGDGTINTIANAIAPHDITLGVLPLGTLNHFARDLGIPTEVDAAARVIIGGHTTQVDAGEVNGHLFLNNSSVGIYPRIVQLRERYRARGASKWVVATWATWRVTRQQKAIRAKIIVDGQETVVSTPLVFIGNNQYKMAGFDAGSRDSIQEGKLAVYVVRGRTRVQLFQLVWRILTGRAQESGSLAMVASADATIDLPFDARVTQLPVAVDGEVTTLDLPLHYVTRPGLIRVLVPAKT